MFKKFFKFQSNYVDNKMKDPTIDFTDEKEIKIKVITWNCGNILTTETFDEMLNFSEEMDIYVICLQEIDMSTIAMIREETEISQEWTKIIMNSFSKSKTTYSKLCQKQMVGLYTCIVVKKDHLGSIKNLRTSCIGTGALGLVGNKGSITIRMDFYNTSLCFMNVHLVHGQNAISKRNQNLYDIFQGTTQYFDPFLHEFFIISGDFNYRLNYEKFEDIKQDLETKNYSNIIKNDQLMIEMSEKKILNDFKEEKIEFLPTYKYIKNDYDIDRIPSFTDRILYKKNEKIIQKTYQSHTNYISSDHKPVSGDFIIKIRVIVPELYQLYQIKKLKEISKMENANIPQLKLDKNSIEMKKIKYNEMYTDTIKIENIGYIPLEWEIINTKTWLSIQPSSGFLNEKESTTISISIHIHSDISFDLTTGKEKLDTIQILSIKNGGDFFISIIGEWIPSCFGCTIEFLCSIGQYSIREHKKDQIEILKVPKELKYMIEYLELNDCSNLTKEDGEKNEIKEIRELLDQGKDLKETHFKIASVFECLIELIKGFKEPVYSNPMKSTHEETLNMIISFLKKINMKQINIIFASVLCRNEQQVEEIIQLVSK